MKFLLSLLVLFYIPGHFLLKRLKKDFPLLDRIVLSSALGLLVTVQLFHLAGLFKMEGIFLRAVTIFSLSYAVWILIGLFYRRRLSLSRPHAGIDVLGLFLMTLFFAALSYITIMTSGRIHPDGLRFYDSNAIDGMAVLSIAQELAKPFPHMVPFWSGTPFVGYHIDSFYWIAVILRQSGVDALKFFFNFMPLFLFPLLLFTVYICSRKIFDRATAIAATFFSLFMADLSWIFFIIGKTFSIPNLATMSFKGSVLPGLIFTQPNIHAIIMLFCGIYFLKLAEDDDRMPVILASALFFGLIFKYKSFYGIAVIAALGLTALISIFQKRKNFAVLKIAAISAAIFIVPALSALKSSSGGMFAFTPGYYGDLFLNNLKPALNINYIRNSTAEIILGSIIFFLGSTGIKILSLPAVFMDITGWRTLSSSRVFIILAAAISFLSMSLITLTTNYAYATSALYIIFQIVLGLYLGKYFVHFLQRYKGRLKACILIVVILLGVLSTLFSIGEYIPPHPRYKFLDHQELAAISFLKKQTAPEAVILHKRGELSWYWLKNLSFLWRDPSEWKGRDCYISALTGRRVVAECGWYMDALGHSSDVLIRQKDVSEFFETNDKNKAVGILKKYKVDYVWSQSGSVIQFDSRGILQEIFAQGGIRIYKVFPKWTH